MMRIIQNVRIFSMFFVAVWIFVKTLKSYEVFQLVIFNTLMLLNDFVRILTQWKYTKMFNIILRIQKWNLYCGANYISQKLTVFFTFFTLLWIAVATSDNINIYRLSRLIQEKIVTILGIPKKYIFIVPS